MLVPIFIDYKNFFTWTKLGQIDLETFSKLRNKAKDFWKEYELLNLLRIFIQNCIIL
jgi:hypothetical protein